MVWEAARATAAAPTYYHAVKIGSPGHEESFIDGGIGCNNPIQQLHNEAEHLFDPDREISCVISIGTGQHKINALPKHRNFGSSVVPIDLIKSLKRMALDSESWAHKMDLKYRDTDELLLPIQRGSWT